MIGDIDKASFLNMWKSGYNALQKEWEKRICPMEFRIPRFPSIYLALSHIPQLAVLQTQWHPIKSLHWCAPSIGILHMVFLLLDMRSPPFFKHLV